MTATYTTAATEIIRFAVLAVPAEHRDAVRRYIAESRDGLRAAEARLARLESDLNAALEN